MPLIKYPKFVQVGQHNVALAGTTTAISFQVNFDDIPVVVACPSTLTDCMVANKTTAGFNVAVASACTVHWIALYSCLSCTGNDFRSDYY